MNQQTEFFRDGATPHTVSVVKHTRGHRIHDNSREAIRDNTEALSERSAAIVRHLRVIARPTTDRRVMESLGFVDCNSVRPRITELVDAGIVRECGKTRDHVTDKTVRLVEVVK